MGVTTGMPASEGVVGPPKIMHQGASVAWQDVGGGEALDSALRTETEKSVGRGGGHMQPLGFSRATHAGLVAVKDGGLAEGVADGIDGRGEEPGAAGGGAHHAARAGTVAEDVLANFRHALAGDDLAHVEIGHGGVHAGAVLGRGGDVGGKFTADELAAMGAKLVLREIFGDP